MSLGKDLSSLPIFRYCTCAKEIINIRGHQNNWLDDHQEQKYTGARNNAITLINLKQLIITQKQQVGSGEFVSKNKHIQAQVIEGLDNCQEQKCTGRTDKTIYLINVYNFIVPQKQYI